MINFPKTKVKILVIGDIMIDHYLWGSSDRISPEAPVPVALISNESKTLGGAGNVVKNLVAFESKVDLLSVIGNCEASSEIQQMLSDIGVKDTYLLKEAGRSASVKSRVIVSRQQVLRFDKEDQSSISRETEAKVITQFKKIARNYDIILISDYGKGLLSKKLTQEIISFSNKISKKVIADPKGIDYSKYKNCYFITPNKKEASEASGINIIDKTSLSKAIRGFKKELNLTYSLITMSEDGISLYSKSLETFPTFAREVFDVTGAGDTVIAALGYALAHKLTIKEAIYFANMASGVVIGKIGSSSASITEIQAYEANLLLEKKTKIIKNYSEVLKISNQAKKMGKTLVFTNGCFDIIHPGHVKYLEKAKNFGDVLIVGLNSDKSVKKLKGESRPINTEIDRAEVLLGLKSVDYVVVFTEETPLKLIKSIRPNVLVKGGDYMEKKVVGEEFSGKLEIVKFEKGKSTSNIINIIKGS
jgi:D-beta-D-heptose 7-phosphate kinase / D-beta-D-heptose 1-phosphate adenosyltransferase